MQPMASPIPQLRLICIPSPPNEVDVAHRQTPHMGGPDKPKTRYYRAMRRSRTVPSTLRRCFTIGTCLALTACAGKRASEDAATKKNVAAQIDRICALPEAERNAALDKLKKESGYEL